MIDYKCVFIKIYLDCRTANSFVRKKACLCLLRLYRRHPDAVPVVEWAPKIVGLLDDSDLASQ